MNVIEVRCCCQPEKLLGWLPTPDRLYCGGRVTYVIPPRVDGPVLRGFTIQPAAVVVFEVAMVRAKDSSEWLALKGDETPLELLRRIPGFQENLES